MEQTISYNIDANSIKQYAIFDIYINKNYVIKFKEDLFMLEKLLSGKLPHILPNTQKFTLLTLSSGNTVDNLSILGPLEFIARKLEE